MEPVHKSFFKIASTAEGIGVQLEMVQNLTTLFDEHLERELEDLKNAPALAAAFVDRSSMLTALLFTIESGLTNISRDLKELSDQAMESFKAHKESQQLPATSQ